MSFLKELWHAISDGFKIAYSKDKSCKNCRYMMPCSFADLEKPYDKREKECFASCGNNMGMLCEAWRPRRKGGAK